MPTAANGAPTPTITGKAIARELLDSSGISAPTTIKGQPGQIWSITALADVFIKFGSAPTAAADSTSDALIPANQTREFAVSYIDEKVAVIDAA